MNVLILSAGTRNKIIQYFKRTIGNNGRIVATDMSELAPAVYEADAFYRVPRITDPTYMEKIFDICRKEKINGVLSLIDPELSLIARNERKFRELGVTVVGSSLELCDMSLDKMSMYNWLLSHGYKCALSYDSIDDFKRAYNDGAIDFPVFVKPINGSASLSISKIFDMEALEAAWHSTPGLMIQQFLCGTEIGIDCYIDLISGDVVSIFTKKKLLMRSGETDKAVSFKDEALMDLVERFALECGYRGQIDIDVFDVDGEYYISEVNPRFGGGYPHAYECGCDHMKLIVNNLHGIANSKNIGNYDSGVYMMKYNELRIMRSEE